jgi:hypothetical protein
VIEGLARVCELIISFIASSCTRALDGSLEPASSISSASSQTTSSSDSALSAAKLARRWAEFSMACRANRFCPGQVDRGQMIGTAKGGATGAKSGKLTSAIRLPRS